MESSYRDRFISKEAVSEYDALYGDASGYTAILHSIEREALSDMVAEAGLAGESSRYLDFATGTGRILTHLEGHFGHSEGVDISPEMVAVSARRATSSNVRCADICREAPPSTGYDLITAFRFFLNADPGLRDAVLPVLVARMAGNRSRIILNNHGRLVGVRRLSALLRKLGRRSRQNTIADAEFEGFLIAHDLQVERKFCYGILGGKIARLLGTRLTGRIERRCAGRPAGDRFGTCAIYVLSRSIRV